MSTAETPTFHLVIGAGPVGTTIARLLAERGTAVAVMSRRGTAPSHSLITAVRGDAADADVIVGHATRNGQTAAAIYNCVNPPYQRWARGWPPMHHAMMAAAERTGAVLVMMDNLYAFGPGTTMPMSEHTPMRAAGTKGAVRRVMAEELLAAHAAGKITATLVRASDFIGPEVRDAAMGERAVPRVMRGKSVSVLGSLDMPHVVSYMPDVAATMVAAATNPAAWGKAWHVPNAPAVTQGQFVTMVAAASRNTAAGTTPGDVKVRALPRWVLSVGAVFVPLLRELKETWYQFAEPWTTDSSATEQALGVTATPLTEAVAATVDWWRRQ